MPKLDKQVLIDETAAKVDAVEGAAKAEETSAVGQTVVAEVKEEHINFDQWWMMMNKKLKLKSHIKEILSAEFKARGLVKNEIKQKFDDAARLFGYKW